MESGAPSSMMRSCGVVSLRMIQKGGLDLRDSSSLPSPCTLTNSISSGPSLPLPTAKDLGFEGFAVKSVPLAFCHDSPVNTAIDVAGPVAEAESREMKSFLGEYAECCTGKLKATPGYDRLYVPRALGSSDFGGTYSPPYVGPRSLS